MSTFAFLLPYLESEEIEEVVLQTGQPPKVKMAGEYRPITSGSMTTAQIQALLAGTPIAALVPAGDADLAPQRVFLEGRLQLVRLARRGGAIQIRIERPPADAPRATRRDPGATKPAAPAPTPPDAPPAPSPPAVATPPPRRRRSSAARQAVRQPPPAAAGATVARAEAAYAARPAEIAMAPRAARADGRPALPARLAEILVAARARRASDVHLVSERPALVRTAGELLPSGDPLAHHDVEAMLLPLLEPRAREALATRGYVDLAVDGDGTGRVRVNVSRQKTGLKGSFRLVMEPLPTLESLGLPAEIAKVTTYHQGLVVIAGPSGHGKTTSLAAIVDSINATRAHHVLTVEEPVEFLHPPKRAVVSQREVGLHTRSFATALKASLREDPDVIVIGELRDRETVEIAIAAAETGHLVLATMSTPSAAKTIDRLIDLFPPEDQQQVRVTLAGALKFVVAQRLLPNVAGDGFVAAVELLTGNAPLWALIRDNKLFQLPSLQQRGKAFGMIRFDDSLMDLVRKKKIAEDAALRFAENKKELAAQLRSAPAPPTANAPPPPPSSQQTLAELAARAKGLFGGKS